jgi:signal transduction histidine kinase
MNQNNLTSYAPAERELLSEVLRQKMSIEASEFLDRVMAKTPYMFLILNDKRQVIYSNHLLMNHLGFQDMSKMAGFRPGELFSCIHSNKEPGGCGTSDNCRYCGALNAVLNSRKKNDLVIEEAIINMNINGKTLPANYRVSSKPFEWKGESFFIVTLEDISPEKRKEQLEKTFFHDIKNKAGTISGFLKLMQENGNANGTFLEIAERGISELLDDITYQQKLVQAEAGNLVIQADPISVLNILGNTCEDYREMAGKRGISIDQTFQQEDIVFRSDIVLLKRVLGNLMKNAIEASVSGDHITAGFTTGPNDVTFSIANPSVMPEKIRFQIFNRSFSTKGTGRGIGTYSIRLFTEDYLNGKVYFTSEEPEGTTFYVILPRDIQA